MGNINNSNKRFLQDWVQVEKQGSPGIFTNTWIQKKGHRKIQMIEYPLHVSSEEDIQQQRKIFWLRLNHPQLVSSMYFLDESKNELCSSNYQGNIFIERIPLTLQTVTDIPFPDALHVYQQSLIGFHVLANDIVKTCFPISEEHIGINCESVCKVWMNPRFEKNFPSRNERIHQHLMVKMIFQTIEDNVDLGSIEKIPSPMNYVYSTSRSPSEVRFDEAITLFQNYVKEFFKGQVPTKLSCVDRVGGVYNLSKNWKNRHDSFQNAVRNQDPELLMMGTLQQQNSTRNLNLNNTGKVPQFGGQTNGYTTFRREEPLIQAVGGQQDSNREIVAVNTPSFNKNGEGSFFSGSKVQFQPIPPQPMIVQQQFSQQPVMIQQIPSQPQVQFPQGRVIHQIVYQNPSTVPPQVIHNFSQKQIVGSVVRMPVENGAVVNNAVTSQRSEVKESFIQNRVINTQVNIPQRIQQSQEQKVAQVSQQLPVIQQITQQQIPQQQFPPQKIIQVPIQGQYVFNQPNFIQRFPQSEAGFTRPLINFVPQQITVQAQPEANGVQQVRSQQQQSGQQINFFGNPVIPQPAQQIIPLPVQQITPPPFQQTIQSSYQVSKTTSVYATPQNITKVEVEKIESNNGIIETQYEQVNKIEVGVQNNLNVRLRNDEQSISSINPQTIQVPSNEQISDKFSTMKQEPMDTSTRNFYTNMMDGDNNTQKPQTNDYFSSYYANYTSKLYDTNEPAGEVQNPLTTKLTTRKQESETTNNNKYKVTLDDGMSSADFLSSLKNIKTTTSPFLKSDTNYDYGLTTYDRKPQTSKFTFDSNKEELYKFDYKNYATKLSDGINAQNDLNIVREKLNIAPAQKIVSVQQKPQYNINYEHQQGQNDAGNFKFESERLQVSGNDGSYAEEYSQSSNYRSIFDKYAAFDNYQTQIPISMQKTDFKLGENLQTQFSRNNTEDQQYSQMTKNTVNNTTYSPMQQQSEEEEYQVDYDPQILADLQKLKGIN